MGQQSVLAPFERGVVVVKAPEQLVELLLHFQLHHAAQLRREGRIREDQLDALDLKLEQQLMEQLGRALVDGKHMLEIKEHHAQAGERSHHVMDHDLGGGEHEVTLKLDDLDASAVGAQYLGFLGGAHAIGIHFRRRELEADHGFVRMRRIEQMQIEVA